MTKKKKISLKEQALREMTDLFAVATKLAYTNKMFNCEDYQSLPRKKQEELFEKNFAEGDPTKQTPLKFDVSQKHYERAQEIIDYYRENPIDPFDRMLETARKLATELKNRPFTKEPFTADEFEKYMLEKTNETTRLFSRESHYLIENLTEHVLDQLEKHFFVEKVSVGGVCFYQICADLKSKPD